MEVILNDGTVVDVGGTAMLTTKDSTTLFPSNQPLEVTNIYKSPASGTIAIMLKSPRGVRMNFRYHNLYAGTLCLQSTNISK